MTAPPPPSSVVIASNFTAQPVRRVLAYLLREVGIDAIISFTPHQLVTVQLLDHPSALAANSAGINVLLLRLDTLLTPGAAAAVSPPARHPMLEQLIAAIDVGTGRANASWIVFSCPPAPGVLDDPPMAELWRAAERRLEELEATHGLDVLRADEILGPYAFGTTYYDGQADAVAAISYTPAFFAALGAILARRIHACVRPPRKVLVVDCDNTLWSGACAEDGPEGIQIDPLRRALHEYLLELQRRGVLLCLCSKNDEADVWRVFEQRTDLIVGRGDIVAWRINWLPKSENIRALADQLQLALDAFVFIDDDAMECAQVRAHLPEVITLRCPSGSDGCQMLKNLWAFDQSIVTDDDRLRTQRYEESRRRQEVSAKAATADDFVAMLGVRVAVTRADDSQVARIAQLTARVTQCNCTLKRWSGPEVRRLLDRDDYEIRAVHASDYYGDYGLVGALIAHLDEYHLDIDAFLLSCRALGRNIERHMMDEIEKTARERNRGAVRLLFEPGPRNAVAKSFLDGLVPPWTRREIGGRWEYVLCLGVSS